MKLAVRITTFALSVLAILGAIGIGVYQSLNIGWALGAVAVAALLMANMVDELLGLGSYWGGRKARREIEEALEEREEDTQPSVRGMGDMPPELRKAVTAALGKMGLHPVSAHRVGDHEEHDEEREKRIQGYMKEVADAITDPDMKEFAFHFAHIAGDCPGSEQHAERLTDLVRFLDARLRASTVQPQNDDDRPQVH